MLSQGQKVVRIAKFKERFTMKIFEVWYLADGGMLAPVWVTSEPETWIPA